MSKTTRSTHTSRQEAYGRVTRQVELQLRPARSHGCDHSGCDRDEQDAGIQLTSRGSGERRQLESLDCSDGVELEDAAMAAVLLGSRARRDGGLCGGGVHQGDDVGRGALQGGGCPATFVLAGQ